MKKPLTLSKLFYKYVLPTCAIVLVLSITLITVIAVFGILFAKLKGH